LEFQSSRDLSLPHIGPQWRAALDALCDALLFRGGLRGVDQFQPVPWQFNWPIFGWQQPSRHGMIDASPQAAPPPLLGTTSEPCPKGVSLDVSSKDQQVWIILNREAFEASLIEWAGARRAAVCMPSAHVSHGQPLHENRQVSPPLGPQHLMPMIRHETICQHAHWNEGAHFRNDLLECRIVSLSFKYAKAASAAIKHVLDAIVFDDAWRTRHDQRS
jgi:hypothetical protein